MKFENIELEGIDAKGKTHTLKLSDLKGKNIILYFLISIFLKLFDFRRLLR